MDLVCPNSPVWDGNRFSACFANMVLGFGANLVTIVMVVVLGFKVRDIRGARVSRLHLLEKLFLLYVPSIGLLACFFTMTLLLINSFRGQIPAYHYWCLTCSQFILWIMIVLFLKCKHWVHIFCNPFLCFWWIFKLFLEVPHLLTAFSSFEVLTYFAEGSSMSAEIMVAFYINVVRVMRVTTENRMTDSQEEALLPQEEINEENDFSTMRWDIMDYLRTLTFSAVNPMMDLGVTKQLDFQDLVSLPSDLLSSSCYETLSKCWKAEQSRNSRNPSLLKSIFDAYGWPYLRLGILKALNDSASFLGPLLLNRLIWFIQQGSGQWNGYILAILLGLSSVLKSFLDTQYSFKLMKLKLKLRAGIMQIVYQKCLQLSITERSKFSDGEIQTFMSVDADRAVNLCNSLHDLWSLPLQISVALYLLYTQVKFAFISGLAITILLIPVNKWISTLIATATENMMKEKDERVRSTGELLANIRTLKMYGWEFLFANRIIEKRKLEVKHLATRKYLDAWCVFFWATTPTLFSFTTFGLFTLTGHSLNAATVFTCIALFNILISPLNSFPWVINGLIDAFISTRRLSRFLSCLEYNPQSADNKLGCKSHYMPECQIDSVSSTKIAEIAIFFRHADFIWSNSEDKGKDVLLKQINLEFPKGILVAVVGEVGSGKSSLLYSILREMRLVHGCADFDGSMTFVPQIPWIMSGSLRDNILFGKEYDDQRYQEVLRDCSLDVDISCMVGGDMACIGEKGTNLSGGQRARLALARALYHDSDIVLLDDVLSAVDAHVACWILHKAILGPLMHQKTCILCTHNVQAISAANIVVHMEKGYVKWSGNIDSFLESPYSRNFVGKDVNSSPSEALDQRNGASTSDEPKPNLFLDCNSVALSEEKHDILEVEFRKEGTVELSVYRSYATFCSWPIVILICISAAFMQASRNGNDMWLSFWVDNTTDTHKSTEFYLVILSMFCCANSVLTLVRAFSFSFAGLRAAVEVHSKLLKNLINGPIQFFDQNPTGRILNRLSSDLYTIDDSLPFILNILLAHFFNLLGVAIVLSYAQVLFLFLMFPLLYIYKKLQFYYRSTSREVRRLDSVSRSPIYSSFAEILDGSPTIRAFNKEEFFMSGFINHVTLYQQTSYSESTAGLWLSLRLQLLAAIIISSVASLSVIGSRESFPVKSASPGMVGLALSYAAPVVSLLSSFLTSLTETEKEMVSVERVLQYMDIPEEDVEGSHPPDSAWPNHGNIEFQRVILRYTPSSMAALSDVSFAIAAGTQVGIIGRTGAGKSSVINALFRLAPISSGRILIDSVDISGFAVRDLRSHLAVVPQSPFLFEGSLRENLDPSCLANDVEIWDTLEKCHIKDSIEDAGGLDIHVKESGVSFSVGQRQLICLARALLKSSKILCLDECTANVDIETTSALIDTISNQCRDMTVITIAHRISVVLDMDDILILDHGILVEQGNPQVLIQDDFSKFSSFARASAT